MKAFLWWSVLLLITVSGLSGCFSFRSKNDPSIISAAPINKQLDDPVFLAMASSTAGPGHVAIPADFAGKKRYLGAVLLDSVLKCRDFANKVDAAQGDANFIGDTFSTLFSALATVAKPITTVHGLTASATVASGTKNAYLSGYFADATVANIGKVMTVSYAVAVQQYMDGMSSMTDENLILPVEVAKIESIHSKCSMASAEYLISQSISTATANAPSEANAGVSVTADFGGKKAVTTGTEAILTVALNNASGKNATLSKDLLIPFTVTAGVKLATPDISQSTCEVAKVIPATNGITYKAGALVPSPGGCIIKALISSSGDGSLVAQIDAGALVTDVGANTVGTGSVPIEFAAAGGQTPAGSGVAEKARQSTNGTPPPPRTKFVGLGQLGNSQ
ncbi:MULTISPECIES: hypothetical protein [unclassified Dyella]|uniref:hypothetical protein n=1 Tax=unclassified Dyella TaxID=2634549 RepID=UPI000C841FB0|nr:MULTISPECIES: hypothetical protein [unclassified Dyella]MDR3447000.1 hypothetical protein [Dyella sp.]PMQ05859.1 hypothetical protein DyAD56_06335 [Dyella sp. AD56]